MRNQPPVACRYASLAEVLGVKGGLPELSPRESRELARFRHGLRARQYCGGRLVAKRMFGEMAGLNRAEQSRIEVLSRTDDGRPSRPRVSYRGRTTDWSLSIAHHGESLLLAACLDASRCLGVDLAPLDPLLARPLSFWNSQSEQLLAQRCQTVDSVRRWAMKEAVYKACNRGEPFAPGRFHWVRDPSGRAGIRYGDCDITGILEWRIWTVDRCVAVLAVADLPMLAERMPDRVCVEVLTGDCH